MTDLVRTIREALTHRSVCQVILSNCWECCEYDSEELLSQAADEIERLERALGEQGRVWTEKETP